MGQLVEGEWRISAPDKGDASGAYKRVDSAFRGHVTADGTSGFAAEAGRYHLFVAIACPWSQRTMLMRVLKKLDDIVSMSFVQPLMLEEGWTFDPAEPLTGARRLYEVYKQANPQYTGKVTVPVLWDKQRRTIVSNESADIVRMFNHEFNQLTGDSSDYYPAALAAEIDAVNERIYNTVNNGVYKAGFATKQGVYEHEVTRLFESLDWLEDRLSTREYLVGEQLTEADWRLFPTLVRFDAVYYGHFKCNRRHVYQYPALWRYVQRLYRIPGIAATIDLAQYRLHYYGSHRSINPSGIVPIGPTIEFG